MKSLSKAEEMEILDKINNMVQKTGNDSYLSISFEGFYNMVKSNIENDMGDSVKCFIDNSYSREQVIRKLESKICEVSKEKIELVDKITELNAKEVEQKQYCESKISEFMNHIKHFKDEIDNNEIKINNLIEENRKKDNIIISLKAKLYDLLEDTK